jgi:hypothetical protein
VLITQDARYDAALAQLVPEGSRLRLVSSEGWVLGRSGQLNVGESAAPGEEGTRWRSLM